MNGKVEIKRLKVDQYGPLKDIDFELESGLNGFYGGNESGKTLLVESITKMLLEDASNFSGIHRTPQKPNGLLNVRTEEGEFDASQEEIHKVFGDVTEEDVRNAFIVRDFDMRLPERENDFGNSDYFKDVTDRILGSKTQKIEALREEIAEIGYLTNKTSSSKLKNTKDTGKLRDSKKAAEKLAEEIEQFQEKIETEGHFRKNERVQRLEETIQDQKEEIKELKKAKKQRKYRKGRKLLEKLRSSAKEKEELDREMEEFKELEEIRKKAENFEKEASPRGFSKKAFYLFAAVSAVSIAAAAFAGGVITIVAAVISILVAASSAYIYRKDLRMEKQQETERGEIIEEAKARDIEASTLPEAVDSINSYEEDLERRKEEVNEKRNQALGKLQAEFSSSYDEPEEWRQELDDFSHSFESVNREFTDGELEEAEDELQELKEEKNELEDELSTYERMLEDFRTALRKELDESFLEEDIVEVSSMEDLNPALRQINEFITSLEENVRASRNAIEVLEEIEEEEEDEFNRIFNKDSYAVEMFRKATDGNYTDIRYEKEDRELKVIRKDGQELDPEALSQGTYDLLYMSVRLKLAREILGEPGFLILDNAFVHSDRERIKKEIEFLKDLEEEGWQIIYLTFREDVREILEAEIDVTELKELVF